MRRVIVLNSIFFLMFSACADVYVDQGESRAESGLRNSQAGRELGPEMDLKTQSDYSRALSDEYVKAARKVQQGQDVAATITFIAAGAFVHGAVGSASDTALANIGIAGAGSTAVATRTLSKSVIQGVYLAARRMNCISAVSENGRIMLSGSSENTKRFARSATYGAIKDVRILVRLAIAREVEDFDALKTSFSDAIKPGDLRESADKQAQLSDTEIDYVTLNRYLKLLDSCLGSGDEIKVASTVDNG